ncbi:MAG TPA: hypothetical protein VF661_05705, partial [Actinomycetales bacterium]
MEVLTDGYALAALYAFTGVAGVVSSRARLLAGGADLYRGFAAAMRGEGLFLLPRFMAVMCLFSAVVDV